MTAPQTRLVSEPLHIISLGAGVQSSTMALMAAAGEITPMPHCAIFADTQDEPASVYKWLDWLEPRLPFPVYRVTRGKLSERATTVKPRRDGKGGFTNGHIPFFTLHPDGTRGHVSMRGCTYDHKLMPLTKEQRRVGKIKRGQKTVGVVSWIGISTDEAQRMKTSRVAWALNRYPLIEAEMNRRKCLEWMKAHGFPEPPRSACCYCPYHHDREWRRIKNDEPEAFAFAVDFERRVQAAWREVQVRKSVPFLHSRRIPLDKVDFSTDTENGQGLLAGFNAECEGMCGV
ncbi:MAG: hypothetical protein WC655_13560 [Candidatus Hydrogenedentales bacterium]|jgi:hypothetical protein